MIIDCNQSVELVERHAYRHLIDKGIIVDWAIRHRRDADGAWVGMPHVHLLATARFWRPGGRHGTRHWQRDAWLQLLGLRPATAARRSTSPSSSTPVAFPESIRVFKEQHRL